MSKKIIIFSTAYFPLVGGAEVAIKEITDRINDYDFVMVTAKIQAGLPDHERVGKVEVYRCGLGKPVDKYLLPFLGAFKAWRLAKQDEVAGIWSMMASFGGFAALFYTWLRPKTKMLLTLQEGDPPEYILKRVRPLGWVFKKIFTRANQIQAISKFLADWGKNMGFKGEPVIIPNGVDVTRFTQSITPDERQALRQAMGFAPDDVVLVTASRLVLKNATDHLILSLTHLPDNYKVLVVGDGEDMAKLKELVAQNKLDNRVVFLGLRGHAELPGLLQSSDIFCRPSLSEGLGNSFLEAMASGIPIIGTPVGGIPDFLTDGETGLFCEPGKPETIAEAAVRIQTEPGLRDKLIRQGKDLAVNQYNWVSIAERMGGVFSSLSRP
ncbi:MAG: GDP-mannose-dependent alpha-(1-6)-phosphatidylinositol monomannoside mannosyltransferase [Parcubacteria group bacterium ADurb.Bin192]|nr:MAG: GDP-mannose-dependent alpha-(1-6)-phosphatidylinositol monomannoside mannosyltransferase [Parcubacteria group bacterium ADurb.Bin192]